MYIISTMQRTLLLFKLLFLALLSRYRLLYINVAPAVRSHVLISSTGLLRQRHVTQLSP